MSSDNTTHSMPSVLKFKYPKKQRQLITNHRKRQMSVFAYILRRTNQEPVATGNIYMPVDKALDDDYTKQYEGRTDSSDVPDCVWVSYLFTA